MSRWLVRLLAPVMLSLGLFLLVSACTPRSDGEKATCLSTLRPPNQPVAKQLNNWYRYTSSKGRYTACFPGKPREEQNVLEAKDLEAGTLVMVIYEDSNRGEVYAISHSQLTTQYSTIDAIEKRLDDAQAGMANGAGAIVENSQNIVQTGHQGRQILLKKVNRPFAKARIVYVDGLLYQIFVIAEDLDALNVTAFLDSVQLQAGSTP